MHRHARRFRSGAYAIPAKAISRMKGAGNPAAKKWFIHPGDWLKLCLEADKIMQEVNFGSSHL